MLQLGQPRGRRIVAGGGSAPVALLPHEIAGLAAWWKADAITGLNHNDPVSSWLDSSGNSLPLSQINTQRPLYQTNVQNSLPGVLFDGVNDCLHLNDYLLSLGAYTIIVAIKFTASGTLWWAEGNDSSFDEVNNTAWPYNAERADESLSLGVAGHAHWMNGSHIITITMDGTEAGSSLRKDGAAIATSVLWSGDPGTTPEPRNFWIGAHDGDVPVAGHYLELAIFTQPLSLAAVQCLEVGLNEKWALY